MPRAPQSRALLAGRPAGEALGVLQQRVADPVDALQQAISTRLTFGTGASRSAVACQTKASAAAKSACRLGRGHALERVGDAPPGGGRRPSGRSVINLAGHWHDDLATRDGAAYAEARKASMEGPPSPQALH